MEGPAPAARRRPAGRAPRPAGRGATVRAALRSAACGAGLFLCPARAVAQLQPSDARFWVAGAVALTGTAAADEWLHDEIQGPGPPVAQRTARAVEPLGRASTALIGLGASYVTARLAKQPAWARSTLRVAAGYLAADAVTALLKPTVGRARPSASDDPYDFHPFSSDDQHHSFPSGHATHAFALAAGISREAHRPWVTAVAYGTASAVGWSRVYDDAHWTSDVVAGALVGTSASLTTIAWLERRQRRSGAEGVAVPGAGVLHAAGGRTVHTWLTGRGVMVSVRF